MEDCEEETPLFSKHHAAIDTDTERERETKIKTSKALSSAQLRDSIVIAFNLLRL